MTRHPASLKGYHGAYLSAACAAVQVLFYCHFPDLLLAQKRSGLHALYRAPLDAVEEFTTGQAHQILVNSKYTQGECESSVNCGIGEAIFPLSQSPLN